MPCQGQDLSVWGNAVNKRLVLWSLVTSKIEESMWQQLMGVPKPVTASQPSIAGNPVVLHPTDEPLVTSVKDALAVE